MIWQIQLDITCRLLNDMLKLHTVWSISLINLFDLPGQWGLSGSHLHERYNARKTSSAHTAAICKELTSWTGVLSPNRVVQPLNHLFIVSLAHVPSEQLGIIVFHWIGLRHPVYKGLGRGPDYDHIVCWLWNVSVKANVHILSYLLFCLCKWGHVNE